ncbi:hypothetical protein ACGF0J_25955 [Nonomuraea sp. NPDC047897]|uniref:hypothetical protein n=1 Tax=Nonomuraea sp. NPDC047897 TaxID=3364346 RepID=UPI00371F1505
MKEILRSGTLALVELEADWADLPGGVRRWPVQWDDLLICSTASANATYADYRLGLSGSGREAIQHAVPAGTEHSLCGREVYPLPICGWSISFTPASKRTCVDCARLVLKQVGSCSADPDTRTQRESHTGLLT